MNAIHGLFPNQDWNDEAIGKPVTNALSPTNQV